MLVTPKTSRPFLALALDMPTGDRELPLSDSEFNIIRKFAMVHAGIEIADYKKNMVRRRISKRLKALKCKTHQEYCDLLASPLGEAEVQPLINALTTNKTEFFREHHHFEHLVQAVVPRWNSVIARQGRKRIRIWSAGCSTGQEPYTIAISLNEAISNLAAWDIKILATDIDTDVLEFARRGVYNAESTASLSTSRVKRFFEPGDAGDGDLRANDELRRLITFNSLNLHGTWPMRGPFDVIFCRNVVIYFDKQAQRRLFNRFADLLTDGGLLYCGHSESLFGICPRFKTIGKSIYEKIS